MTGAPQAAAPPRRHLGTRTFALLTLGYVSVALYGSLVPFHYRPLSWEESFARWHQATAASRLARTSGSFSSFTAFGSSM